jgi:hypothetical protein
MGVKGGIDWIDMGHGWDFVNRVMKLRVPKYAGNFLSR